jgi:hypothetical protein
MTIFELALDHMQECGMSEADAVAAVEQFGAAGGRDIEWGAIAPRLSVAQLKRIDDAAVGWLHAHRLALDAAPETDPPRGRMNPVECAARVTLLAIDSGMTVEEFASRINHATREEIAQAMEQLPTDALEWAVKFEALSHRGKGPTA